MTSPEYYQANKERVLASNKAYRAANKERLAPLKKAYAVGYYQNNKPRFAEQNRIHRNRQRVAKPWLQALRCVRVRAKERNISYALSPEWGQSVWTGTCALTGLPFIIDDSRTPGPKPFSPTIDRIVPSLGYVPENCRFILACVNNFRGTMGDDDMIRVAEALLSFRIGLDTLSEGTAQMRGKQP